MADQWTDTWDDTWGVSSGVTGTVAADLPGLTASVTGSATPPPVTGTVAATLPGLTAAVTGVALVPAADKFSEIFTSSSPFTSGNPLYDSVSGGELVHAGDTALAHRVRWRNAEPFIMGSKVSVRVKLDTNPASPNLGGVAFVNPLNTTQQIMVVIDTRNGAGGAGAAGTTAGLQIRESTGTSYATGVAVAVTVSTWYRVTAWITSGGTINGELRDDSGTLLATVSQSPSLYVPFDSFYPGLHSYGNGWYDDYRIGPFDVTAAADLPALTASVTAAGGARAATVDAFLPVTTAAASGSVTPPPGAVGNVDAILPALTAAATGSFSSSGPIVGLITAVLPALWASILVYTITTPQKAGTMSNQDLEREELIGLSNDPGEAIMSIADLKQVVYSSQDYVPPTASLSAADVEIADLRAASADPNKDKMSLADLRRAKWESTP